MPDATECYQRFLKHRNLHYGACAFLLKSDRICTVLGIMRSKESGRFTSAELDRIRSLVPHVQRVLRIQDNASDLATQRDLLHGVVDHAAVGLILLEKNGTFLMANNRARAVLDRGTLLRTEHGLLRAASKNDDRALQDSIQRTLQRFQKTPGAEIVPLGQATSDPEVTGPWLRLLIVPAQNGGTPAPSSAAPAAIVHIVDPAAPPRVDREMLRRVFSLSKAEAAVAANLACGFSVVETADRFHVSHHTVRSHVKNLFVKTGITQQSALVSLILRVPSPLPDFDDGGCGSFEKLAALPS
jgi:DNA-binding CsgD family transcriptional regulator